MLIVFACMVRDQYASKIDKMLESILDMISLDLIGSQYIFCILITSGNLCAQNLRFVLQYGPVALKSTQFKPD